MAMAMVMVQLKESTHSTTGRRLTISENFLWRLIWLLRRYTCYRLPARLLIDVTFTPSSCSLFVSFVWIHYLIDKPWDLFKSVLTLGVKKKKPLEVEVRRLIPRVVLTTKVRLCSSLILFAHAFTGLGNSRSSATGRFEMRKSCKGKEKGESECFVFYNKTCGKRCRDNFPQLFVSTAAAAALVATTLDCPRLQLLVRGWRDWYAPES